MPLRIVTVASGGFEQSLLTILPLRNCTGPVVPGLGACGFGAVSASSSSSAEFAVTAGGVGGLPGGSLFARSLRAHSIFLQRFQVVQLLFRRRCRDSIRSCLQSREHFPRQVPLLARNINLSQVELVLHITR